MKDILTNKLGSFQATLGIADTNTLIWTDQPPTAFADGLAMRSVSVVLSAMFVLPSLIAPESTRSVTSLLR
jgi:hypothetical protein